MHASAAEQRYVYFIRAAEVGLIKIGVANCVHKRLAGMGHTIPLTLEILGVMPCGRHSILEQMMHGRFKHLRQRGEWFTEAPELLEHIKEHCQPAPPVKRLTLLERRQMNAARRAKRKKAPLAA